MGLGIIFSAAAVESGLEDEKEETRGLSYWRRWAFVIGVFCVTLSSTLAQALHKEKQGSHHGGHHRCRKPTRTCSRLGICFLVLLLPLVPWPTHVDRILFLFIMVLLLVIMLVCDRCGRSQVTSQIEQTEDARGGGTTGGEEKQDELNNC